MFASFMSKFELEKFGAIQIFFLCITHRDVIVDILKIKFNFIESFNFAKKGKRFPRKMNQDPFRNKTYPN